MEWPKFRGSRRDSAEEYIDELEAAYLLADISSHSAENRDKILKVRFRAGLHGDAERWLRVEATAADKVNFASLCDALKKRFPEPASNIPDTTTLQEACNFQRRKDESLSDFTKRADKLNVRLRSDEIRNILANNLLFHIADDEKDLHIQERVLDRLANKGKVLVTADGHQTLTDTCRFRDVLDEIRACSHRFGQTRDTDEDLIQDDEDDPISRRDFSRFQKVFERLAEPDRSLARSAPPVPTQTAPPQQPPPQQQGFQPHWYPPQQASWPQHQYNQAQPPPPSGNDRQQPPGRPWERSDQNRGTYNYQGVRRLIECDNCKKIGDHVSTNCPEPQRPFAEVQRNRAERRLREEQARKQAESSTTTIQPPPASRTTRVASVQVQDEQDMPPRVNAILSPPWHYGGSHEVRRALDAMELREADAVTEWRCDAEVRAAQQEPTRPARQQKGKGVLAQPDDARVTKTRIVLKKPLSAHVLPASIQPRQPQPNISSRQPRIVEIPDEEYRPQTSRRVPSPSPPSPQPMDQDDPEDADEGSDRASDPSSDDIDDVEDDFRGNWQKRLMEELAAAEAERARQEFLQRGKRSEQARTLVPGEVSDDDIAKMEKALSQLQANYQAATKNKPVKDRMRITALAQTGVDPLNIGTILKEVRLEVPLWQLLDIAPRARADLNRLLTTETHAAKGRKKKPKEQVAAISFLGPVEVAKPLVVDDIARMWYKDVALSLRDVGDTSVGYVSGFIDGMPSDRLMLDNGASIDCVSPGYVARRRLSVRTMEEPWVISLAGDQLDSISKYVILDIVVGDILTVMTAFVYGSDKSFEVLLSQSWYKRVRAVQDWEKGTIVVKGRNGLCSEIPFRPASGERPFRVALASHEHDDPNLDELDVMERFAAARRLMTVIEFGELVARVLEGKGSS
ncbi:hypothetical protein NKR19_g3373 [Coniochaeta hoffmannii]|uniref:Uncharacterized protein n=1 Tax=Coniochaeta hoffmannii TaxID=91930 RepID=A0AA38VRE3_9PEZI|nr:hypothetical protein NKR19_g3373 [Coniochaeta hoffmannii]